VRAQDGPSSNRKEHMKTRLALATACAVAAAVAICPATTTVSAGRATNHPLEITLKAVSEAGVASRIFGDAGSALYPYGVDTTYTDRVARVSATLTDSTGTITFANAAGTGARLVNIDLEVEATDTTPAVSVSVSTYQASWMKPYSTPYDIRTMREGQAWTRVLSLQWPGANNLVGSYHLRWDPKYGTSSDALVSLTCTTPYADGSSAPCSSWTASPLGQAMLRKVTGVSKNVALWEELGYVDAPFEWSIQQCDVPGASCQ
jgi:hypothetical protein